MTHTLRHLLLATCLLLAGVPLANAGDYPQRPIRLVVPFAAGGGTDTLGRIVAARLQQMLKQPLVVDNVTGATGTIGSAAVAKALPDGYTLLLGISGTHAIAPGLYSKLPYKLADFVPVGELATMGNAIAVNNALPVHDVKELVTWARQQKEGFSYGSWGIGSGGHLAMELLRSQAGIQATHIPYKGALPALTDAMAGQIPVAMTDVASAGPLSKAGKVRIIAVTGSRRAPSMPNVPTLAEQGVPFDTDSWYALFAPAHTPPAVLDKLRSAVAAAMKEPEVASRLAELGMNAPTLSPAEFSERQAQDVATWARLVKLSGATID